MKKNCWEVKNCERQSGGSKIDEFGTCPAALARIHHGKNGGKNAGRYCWKIAGTLCKGEVQGTWAKKMMNCAGCDFFKQVKQEEGENIKL